MLSLYADGLRMGVLARRAHLSKQTMTELIRRLERDGLVERRPDPSDARASLIFLTARSRWFAPVAAAILAELDRLARGRLGLRRVAECKAALAELVDLGERRRRAAAVPRARNRAQPFLT